MANNTFETYVELLPKTWFAYETPRNPRMLLSGSVLLSELEAFEKANPPIIKYDQPKDPRVAHYISMSPSEKIKFLCSFDLTEINKFIYKGFYQAGRFNEAKPKTYTYIDYLCDNFPHLHNRYKSLYDSVNEKPKEDKPKEDKSKEDKPKEDKPKKKTIPKALKASVWITYIGKDIGATKCPCCNTHEITQLSFDCGHVIAEALGGKTTLENLRPICSKCNKSMRTTHMNEFKKHFFQ
jgi:5-methylcytosine-specific restriction endonuclease McrA